jgi:hypothetical protein
MAIQFMLMLIPPLVCTPQGEGLVLTDGLIYISMGYPPQTGCPSSPAYHCSLPPQGQAQIEEGSPINQFLYVLWTSIQKEEGSPIGSYMNHPYLQKEEGSPKGMHSPKERDEKEEGSPIGSYMNHPYPSFRPPLYTTLLHGVGIHMDPYIIGHSPPQRACYLFMT